MVVGVKNRIETGDIVCQALLPQVTGSVDEKMVITVANEN
jgi:hypothetical protein